MIKIYAGFNCCRKIRITKKKEKDNDYIAGENPTSGLPLVDRVLRGEFFPVAAP